MLNTALAAGLAAGLAASLLQAAWVWPLIDRAEKYELCAPALECPPGQTLKQEKPLARMAYTAMFNILSGVGFALLLSACFVMRGGTVGWRQGVCWGIAGFAAFSLAPALGLPPSPPGAAHAPLLASQAWWLACAAATAAGLAMLVFVRPWPARLAALALLALPHVVGAPHVAGFGFTPDDLVFAQASLAAAWFFWILLGGVSGLVYGRIWQGVS